MLKNFKDLAPLLDYAPCGIGLFVPGAGDPFYLNRTFYQIIGYSEKEFAAIAANSFEAIIYPQDRPLVANVEKELESLGCAADYEYRILCKNGTLVWVKLNASHVTIDNKKYVFTTFLDVTREKKASANLALLAEHIGSSITIVSVNPDGVELVYANEDVYQLTGYTPEEYRTNLKGLLDKVLYEEDSQRLQNEMKIALKTEKAGEIEYRLRTREGKLRWVSCKYAVLHQSAETSLLLSITTDITEVYGNMQRVLGPLVGIDDQKEKSLMLESLINALPGGVAIIKVGTTIIWKYFTDGFARLSDRTREEMEACLQDEEIFYKTVIPEDYPQFIALFKEKSSNGEPINSTFRYAAKNGEIRWCHITATKIQEEDGCPVYYAIFTQPADESMLYRQVVEGAPVGICISAKKSRRVLFCNAAWRRIENIPENLVISGQCIFDLVPKDRQIFTQEQVDALPADTFSSFMAVRPGDIHLTIQGKSVNWNGVDAYVLYFSDQTEEYRQREKMKKLLDNIPGGVGIYDYKNGALILKYINDGYYRIIDSSRAKRAHYIGTDILKMIRDDDSKIVKAALQPLAKGQDFVDVSFRVPKDQGDFIWIRLVGAVVERRSDNDMTIYSSFSDVSSLINLQNNLSNSRSLLVSALTATHISAWELDIPTRTQTLMHSATKFPSTFDIITNFPYSLFDSSFIEIHPNSLADAKSLCDDAMAGKYAVGEIYLRSLEDPNNEFRWEKITYTPIQNISGPIIQSICTSIDITKQKQQEQNYEERLSLHKAITKDTLGLVSINLTKNILTESTGASILLRNLKANTTAKEMLKIICSSIPDEKERQEFMALFSFANLRKANQENKSHLSLCHKLSHRQGWVETSCELLNNPYTGDLEAILMARDVSREKQYEQVVNTLVSSDYDVIFIIDTATSVLQLMYLPANVTFPAWPEHAKITMDTVVGYLRKNCQESNVEEIIEQNSLPSIKKHLAKNSLYITSYSLLINGQLCYKRMAYSYPGNDKRSILCAVQDYTASQQQEQQQKLALGNALAEAKRAGAAKSDFLSDMSHEIRTPMNSIIGMSKLAQDEVLNNPQLALRYLEQIDSSSDYLLGIINDILDMSRIESNKFELHYEWISPLEVIDSSVQMIESQMLKKGLHFHVVKPSKTHSGVEFYVDAMRTKQLLINLLNNAYKFTPEGGTVSLEIRNKSQENGNAVDEITVTDTGCGISKEFQEHIFEPFTQERNAETNAIQGTGLGLTLVKKIITAMGGTVKVASELKKGSTFTLELPYKYRLKAAPTEKDSMVKADESLLQGACVMLAEDHPLNSLIATRLLEKKHVEVVPVSNGQQALDQFSASPAGRFDAILMDIRMPLLNGWEASKAIRALSRKDAKTIPIIAMTANAFEDDVKTSLQCGMNGHLSKPIEPKKLYETLTRYLTKAKQKSQ